MIDVIWDVKFDQVYVKYGGFAALDNLSFSLEGGKIYGLIGRNGAGKTTLLSLLASYIEPTSGTVLVGGDVPFENETVMEQVTFVHETDYRNETDTVKDMLEGSKRYRPHFDADYAAKLVERFGLPLHKKIGHLSKGMQSALSVTVGLANRSPVTLYDEAYQGMDAPTREIFYRELLEDQAAHPRTILFSTHFVSEMDYLFDEVLILDRGKLLLQESYDLLIHRGVSVTGSAESVDEFTRGLQVLNVQRLGGTNSAMVYGELDDGQRRAAKQLGLELGPVPLQDLFIHLTRGEEVSHEDENQHL